MGANLQKPIANPLVSVIIPFYNAERYLADCIESVMMSSLENIEIICVDDGSTDNSSCIVDAYSSVDSRIRLISQPHRCAGAARNTGICAARGTYIHFLDADDWVDGNAYASWYKTAIAYSADVCECLFTVVDAPSGSVLFRARYRHFIIGAQPRTVSIDEYADTLIYGQAVPWNRLYLRSFLIENDIRFDELSCAEDRAFYFDVIYRARTNVRVAGHWVFHRVNIPTSLDGSDVRLRDFDVEFKSFEHIWRLVENAPDDEKAMVLDSCINDSISYFKRAVGTQYEQAIADRLFEYWRPYIPLLGDAVYDKNWYAVFFDIVASRTSSEYYEHLRGLYDAYKRETAHRRMLDKLLKLAVNAGMHIVGPINGFRNKIGM